MFITAGSSREAMKSFGNNSFLMDNSIDFVVGVQNWADREFYKNGNSLYKSSCRRNKGNKCRAIATDLNNSSNCQLLYSREQKTVRKYFGLSL